MADTQSFLFVSELVDDFALTMTNDILEDNDDDMFVLAAVSCFMRRKLTRIHDYFEATLPRYLSDEFKNHFRMTRETRELLCQAVIQTVCLAQMECQMVQKISGISKFSEKKGQPREVVRNFRNKFFEIFRSI